MPGCPVSLLDFLAGFAVGVLCVFGVLGLAGALFVAWARKVVQRALNGAGV